MPDAQDRATGPSSTGRTGTEPDYRFTLANERTFLAWMRTCLALLAGSVAIIQYAPDLGSRTFREICGIVLAALATGTAAGGLVRWLAVQRAMRRGQHLRRGSLPVALAVGLAVLALGVVTALAVGLAR